MRDVILLEPVEEGLRLQAFFEEPVTVQARVERQNANAMAVATFLQKHPRVRQVFYPGLESHPHHDLAARQMRGFGGVLAFEIEGGQEAVGRLLPRLRHAYMAANLGQVATIVGTPATTSMWSAPPRSEQQPASLRAWCAMLWASRMWTT